MDRFERRKEKKKESIRQASLELFKLYGFKKVSINDIAHKAGVSPVTIYNHFGSKDELVHDTIKNLLYGMLERIQKIIDNDSPFPEKVEAIVFDKSQTVSQFQGELTKTLLQSGLEMQAFVDKLIQEDSVRMTKELFEQGRKEGYVSKKISDESLFLYFQILRYGLSATAEAISKVVLDENAIRELNNLFLYGMIGKQEISQ